MTIRKYYESEGPIPHTGGHTPEQRGGNNEQEIINAVTKKVSELESKDEKSSKSSEDGLLKKDIQELEDTLQYIRNVMVNNNFTQPDQLYKYFKNKHDKAYEMWARFEASDPLNEITPSKGQEGEAERKAKELISKFTFLTYQESDAKFYNPKQCALICVDEIIKLSNEDESNIHWGFWQQVRNNIVNL